MKTPHSNKELATEYVLVMAQYVTKYGPYIKAKNSIETSKVNIADFFSTNGSLADLNVHGIGAGTRAVLESILKNGLEEARRIIAEQRERGIREAPRIEAARDREAEELRLRTEGREEPLWYEFL